jgi:hypothetical protein
VRVRLALWPRCISSKVTFSIRARSLPMFMVALLS